MKKNGLLLFVCFFYCQLILAQSQPILLQSPDGFIEVSISLAGKIYYQINFKKEILTLPSPISMTLEKGQVLGINPVLKAQRTNQVKNTVATVWGKRKNIPDEYNESILDFGNYEVIFRAYNQGFAYRIVTKIKEPIKIMEEEVNFKFPENHSTYFPGVKDLQNSFEENYQYVKLNDKDSLKTAFCPVLVDAVKAKVLITEADLWDYPALNLERRSDFHNWFHLKGKFAHFPLRVQQGGIKEFNLKVTERADYIAITKGERSFPWRLMLITDDDKKLADSDLVYLLSAPTLITDTEWIKPGKVAWDWFNANNLVGMDFKTGVNTQTYKYYIDFASRFGLEYVILDEGWSDTHDLTLLNPEMDVPELVRYAKEKNVGIIVWCVWHSLDRQLTQALDLFVKWGISGVKVDFMDRDDQLITQFYEKIAKETAQRKLIVDFHGCGKPTGMSRTYPNILNYEGVLGNEFNKWSEKVTPEHNLLIPFIRMAAGVMDYTPGAMRNAGRQSFRSIFEQPMSQGTRCHQLAMYVVYEAGLQMLCDAPTEYEKDLKIMNFLSKVPVSWNETMVLDAKLGDYLVIARKKGEEWYIGGMTDWAEKEIELDLSFLGNQEYTFEIYKDGVNAHKYASDYQFETFKVRKENKIKVKMYSGGGFAIRIYP